MSTAPCCLSDKTLIFSDYSREVKQKVNSDFTAVSQVGLDVNSDIREYNLSSVCFRDEDSMSMSQ